MLPAGLKPEDASTKTIDDHIFFFTGHSSFSNLAKCEFKFGNEMFKYGEQGYQYEKTMRMGDRKAAENIMKVDTPEKMKKLGRKAENKNQIDWDTEAKNVNLVNRARFNQCEKCMKVLLDSGYKILVEASHHDRNFGIGMALSDKVHRKSTL